MNTWFKNLSARERTLVTIAVFALLSFILWFFLVRPIFSTHQKLNKRVSIQKESLATMKSQSAQIKFLNQQATKNSTNNTGVNTQQVIDTNLNKWQLKKSLQRMQAQGENKVKITLKDANADKFMNFYNELETVHNLNVANMSIRASEKAGLANIRMTVER